jgi:hypothetical protein
MPDELRVKTADMYKDSNKLTTSTPSHMVDYGSIISRCRDRRNTVKLRKLQKTLLGYSFPSRIKSVTAWMGNYDQNNK